MDNISKEELQKQRSYRLAVDGVANIREYGAIGDGETDDTAAFKAAVDAITSNHCGARAWQPGPETWHDVL